LYQPEVKVMAAFGSFAAPAETEAPNPILLAGPQNDLAALQSLDPSSVLMHSDDNGFSPLLSAVQYSNHEIIAYIVTVSQQLSVADVINSTKDSDGDGVLFHCEDVATARLLVETYGADIFSIGGEGLDVVAYRRKEIEEESGSMFDDDNEDDDEDDNSAERAILNYLETVREKKASE